MSSSISQYILTTTPIPVNLTAKRVYISSPIDLRIADNAANANGQQHFLLLGTGAAPNKTPMEVLNPGNRIWVRTDAGAGVLYIWEVFE